MLTGTVDEVDIDVEPIGALEGRIEGVRDGLLIASTAEITNAAVEDSVVTEADDANDGYDVIISEGGMLSNDNFFDTSDDLLLVDR